MNHNNHRFLRLSISGLSLFQLFLFYVSAEPIDQQNTDHSPSSKHPFYQQKLELLRKHDDVIPPKLAVHPVEAVYNREAIIPPMCYTRTEGKYNPCYVCHQNPRKDQENTMADGALQLAYSFSDTGMRNHWNNLFEDKSAQVAAISDQEILNWIDQDNYSELATRLKKTAFKGWIPDLKHLYKGAQAFDAQGFAKDGSHWVAFNYKPFPSTFWPTNGSTDDTMIRLAEAYRTTTEGHDSDDIYRANLAIVEANIKGLSTISVHPTDERNIGVDLDGNDSLEMITQITALKHYVGAAHQHFLQQGTYPAKTEFLHTVRYLGINDDGTITPSMRMKEVRYMKKWVAHPLVALREYYREEQYAKDEGYLPSYANLRDQGLDNGMGWSIQGFIENRKGRLRSYTYEENLACMGCHASIGSTIDKTFSFPRKIDGADGWGYINLKGMSDAPNRGEKAGEILTYLQRIGGGGEFRSNPEMQQRWFNSDGSVNTTKILSAPDVYTLITPSKERALILNKAYRSIVEQQDYIYGRDATIQPPKHVYRKIDNDLTPTLPKQYYYDWDIRLDWKKAPSSEQVAKQH